jgi:hypothetical protein
MTTYYLYVKTHINTGLKYLGQTIKQDPHKYTGSGKRWLNHLNKHGYNYNTEILAECKSKEELRIKGEYYSILWNVVNDDNWANIKMESGTGGGLIGKDNGMYGKKHNKETREKYQRQIQVKNCHRNT